MSTELALVEHLDEINNVVTELLKGHDPTKISKNLGIPRTRVVANIAEWKSMTSGNDVIRSRAKDALVGADEHYNKLIVQAYEVIEEATTQVNLSAKTAAIKLVMDIEKTRIEMLQKAGLLENKELAEEMVAIERKQTVLVGILRDIASTHPEVADLIMQRLSSIASQGEVITIVHSDV
jgi:hypothetical protein